MNNSTELESNNSAANRTTPDVGNVHISFATCTLSIAAVVLGLPGNILIIHAVRSRKQMQNARNYFIESLACSDIVALLIIVPFSTLNIGQFLRYIPEGACKSLVPTTNIVVAISLFTHAAIALERRRAIVFPFLTKPSPRRIKSFIAIIWLVPAIVLGPTSYPVIRVSSTGHICTYDFTIGPGEAYISTFFFASTASSFVIPLVVTTCSYRQIIRTLKQNAAEIEELAEANAAVALRLKNQRQVVNSLLILVCAFVILITPFGIVCLLWFMGNDTKASSANLRHRLVTASIYYMVYALNPVILYISSTEYRLAFNDTFKVWKNLFGRAFSCCSKSKSLNGNRSKQFPSVIVLSAINKRADEN